MLKRWIYEGELEDPFDEFFVAIDPAVEDGNLWRSKYTMRHDMVPLFLHKALVKKVRNKPHYPRRRFTHSTQTDFPDWQILELHPLQLPRRPLRCTAEQSGGTGKRVVIWGSQSFGIVHRRGLYSD